MIDLSKLRVDIWPVSRIVPYESNARTHSDKQIDDITKSIKEFGWTCPLLVTSNGSMVAGHSRLRAAIKLRMSRVPVIVLDHLSDVQRRALIIADNRIALDSSWDADVLKSELSLLQGKGFDTGSIGFSSEELEGLLSDAEEPEQSDAVIEAGPSTTKLGDMWLMGNHKLLCGDSTDVNSLRRVLSNKLASLVFTDPPYFPYTFTSRYRSDLSFRIILDGKDLGDVSFYDFLRKVCDNILAMAGGAIYIHMASSELVTLHKAFVDAGGHWSTFIIWAKNSFALGWSDYQRQYETILYGWKEGCSHSWFGGSDDHGDVWFFDRPTLSGVHPTIKSVELAERAIRNNSKSGDTVLDPFVGSGTTVIACEKTGRCAMAIEYDPKYCDVVIKRWQEQSGKEAKLESTGKTFETVSRKMARGAA